MVADVRAGRGVALFDPHGDLVDRVLDLVPRRRINDVVLFDPSDIEHPVGMNVLQEAPAAHRPRVASGILGAFRKVFKEFWGPRLEHVFRNALLALLEVRGSTLLGVPRLFLEERFRESVLRQVQDPEVRRFWLVEYPSYGRNLAAEAAAPVLNKVGAVLTSPLLRGIVGQARTSFNCRKIMDDGGILLANLAKGRVGEDASAILGALLLSKLQLAAYGRAELPPETRRPFHLYIDEAGSIATAAFGELLAEARKFGLGVVLACQYLGQLDEPLRQAVLGNVGTTICFRLGAEDAEAIGKEFEPEITAHDLTHLHRHQIALRLSIRGVTSAAFTGITLPPHQNREGHAEKIRRVSRERYGTPPAAQELTLPSSHPQGSWPLA